MINWEQVARELIRAMRGRASGTLLSGQLGHRFNQIARWERGTKIILWTEFLAYSRIRHVDVAQALEVCRFSSLNPLSVEEIFKELFGKDNLPTAAARIGIPAQKLRRWVTGRTDVPLWALLKALHVYRPESSLDFISRLTPMNKLPSLAAEWEARERARALYAAHPEASGVVHVLALKQYAELGMHDDRFVARRTGLPIEHVRKLLLRLLEVGFINYSHGRYTVSSHTLNFIDPVHQAKINAYWLKNALRAFERPGSQSSDDYFQSCIFSVSEEGLEKIHKHYTEFFTKFQTILKEDPAGSEKYVKVFTSQMVDIEAPRP